MNAKTRPWIEAFMIICVLILADMLSACSGENGPPVPPPTLSSIDVTPPNPSIAPGTAIQLTAVGAYSNQMRQDLTYLATWTSSDNGIATVNNSGLVTAKTTTGFTTISALFGAITGSTTLTTTSITAISISPPMPPSIAPGTIQKFVALGMLANTAVQDLTSWATWTSSDNAIASVINGLAAAVSAGTATITASYQGESGTAEFTSSLLSSITVSPPAASIAKGTTQQFTAAGTLADTTIQDLTSSVTWISSNTAVATISNKAGSRGLATAVSGGTSTVNSTFSGVISSAVTLTVTPAVITSITVTPMNPSLALGNTQKFIAIGTFSDNTKQDITASASWSSSSMLVSTISNSEGSQGLATSVGIGTTTIKATLGVISGKATLTVTPAVLESIEVTPLSTTISISTNKISQQYVATGIFTDGSTEDLTQDATWKSSDTNVATITNTGLAQYTFIAVLPATTDITATFSDITSNNATLAFTF